MIFTEKNYIMIDSKIFLDTNILVYATFEDFDLYKHRQVVDILTHLSEKKVNLLFLLKL